MEVFLFNLIIVWTPTVCDIDFLVGAMNRSALIHDFVIEA